MKTKLNLILCAMLSTTLVGCGDATTNIVEKDPIVEPVPAPGDGHDHGDHDEVSSEGRLVFTSQDTNELNVVDLHDKEKHCDNWYQWFC